MNIESDVSNYRMSKKRQKKNRRSSEGVVEKFVALFLCVGNVEAIGVIVGDDEMMF